ncbi:hypothetical protein OG552_13020 [Streptomyces sp. NBC_01476]|uniref:hypothetical protein n=1 Tax=Streptomyces sp. NBC_01476 TaxID=2903881 RepID=UPI002E35A416|nr:hypothetical protein [Streptomyces sp. NBC_01476]
MNVINELKSLSRTRKIVNGMLWFITGGAVFYSLMTSTPLVSSHSQWSWSGWILGLLTDAAFVLALSADATLSKYGKTGGKWPGFFRWATGVASLFLNTWNSVAERDWVGVAIHSISPVILVCASEVAPIYRRKFRYLELELSGPHVQGSEPVVQSSEVHSDSSSQVRIELAGSKVQPARGSSSQVQADSPLSSGSLVQVQSGSSSGSGSNGEAIRAGFTNYRSASEVAREIGVSSSYVSRKYKELREELALTA